MKHKREGVEIYGKQSCPIYVEYITNKFDPSNDNILLVASSHRFNESHIKFSKGRTLITCNEYDESMSINPSLFKVELLNDPKVVEVMDVHLCSWLDWYVEQDPNIKFVFLCEFFTDQKRVSSPKNKARLLYNDFLERYPSNHLDLNDLLIEYDVLLNDISHANNDHLTYDGNNLFLDWLLKERE